MFKYFSMNGEVLPIEKAVVPISNIEYSYGFGVYETIRVSKGVIYFLDEHIKRLILSASKIGLEHNYDEIKLFEYVNALVSKTTVETYNIKILLIGASKKEGVILTINPSSPLFPDRKLYRDGVSVCTYSYERLYPSVKSLNMLGSYMAYKHAGEEGCYDALLVSENNNITEGTRSNFFFVKNDILHTPKLDDVLDGITRTIVLKIAKEKGISVVEQDINIDILCEYHGAFLTNTSSKIMPVKSIDGFEFTIPTITRDLMESFNDFWKNSNGILN